MLVPGPLFWCAWVLSQSFGRHEYRHLHFADATGLSVSDHDDCLKVLSSRSKKLVP